MACGWPQKICLNQKTNPTMFQNPIQISKKNIFFIPMASSTVIEMTQKLFKSKTTILDSGLRYMSRDQKFQAKHEFEGFKR